MDAATHRPGFGVYVHFPYCRQRCAYCDFAVAVRPQIPHQEYLQALLHELAAKAPLFAGRRARSVYFGGGTPSLWSPDCLAQALGAILTAFPAEDLSALEVTLECDPGDVSLDQLVKWRQSGVNRLSIGAQTFSASQLAALRRQHQPHQISELVLLAREAGFSNLSIDLLIGMSGQTESEQIEDFEKLLILHPEHVSLYQLTVEPHTMLAVQIRRGQAVAPSPDAQADAYTLAQQTLAAAGFRQYEISNFARALPNDPDHRAVHNRLYWTHGEYLGIGVSAHSFRHLADGCGERFANLAGPSAYLRAWQHPGPTDYQLSTENSTLKLYERRDREALWREALWLKLRELDGVHWPTFLAMHQVDPRQACRAVIDDLLARGLLHSESESLRLSARGVLFADEVGAAFL